MKKNLTHTQLASQFEKAEGVVRSWELGRTKPSADTLIKLAEYFNCTTDYLLGMPDIDGRIVEVDKGLDKYSNDELLREIRRRMTN